MRALVITLLLTVSGCQCFEPVSDDRDAGADAGADAGLECGVTLRGAINGTLSCPFVLWNPQGDLWTFHVSAQGGPAKLEGLFSVRQLGRIRGAVGPGVERMGGGAFVQPAGWVGQSSYWWNVWNPPELDAGVRPGERGDGTVDLLVTAAGLTGVLELRFIEDPLDGGAPGEVVARIVLP